MTLEKLAHDLAGSIALKLNYDEDKKSVIAYGLTAIFQMATIAAIITVAGILFDFWYECFIIFIGVGIIRKSTGGAHSQTMYGCLIISCFSIIGQSALSKYVLAIPIPIWLNVLISIAVAALCFAGFYKRVPVDSPNKPIVRPEKIKRLRKQSYIVLIVFFLLSLVFVFLSVRYDRFYSIANGVRLALLWQLFTLTKPCAKFIRAIDTKLNPFFKS